MGTMASQITILTIVYSTGYSGADQRKHKSSASLAFVWGIHRGPVNSPHKWPVTRKVFPFDDVIMDIELTVIPALINNHIPCKVLNGVLNRGGGGVLILFPPFHDFPNFQNHQKLVMKICHLSHSYVIGRDWATGIIVRYERDFTTRNTPNCKVNERRALITSTAEPLLSTRYNFIPCMNRSPYLL